MLLSPIITCREVVFRHFLRIFETHVSISGALFEAFNTLCQPHCHLSGVIYGTYERVDDAVPGNSAQATAY